jgi:hypothetical protein
MAVLAAAVISVSESRAALWLSLGLGVPTAVQGIGHVFVASNGIAVSRRVFAIAFIGYVVAVMLGVIFKNRQVTFNTVSASLCVYLLLGFLWSVAYSLIDL